MELLVKDLSQVISAPVARTGRPVTVRYHSDHPREIYIIRCTRLFYLNRPQETIIKVGRSIDPQQRLRELQGSCPFELELVCIFPGTRELEEEFHTVHATSPLHIRGEWYKGNKKGHRQVGWWVHDWFRTQQHQRWNEWAEQVEEISCY